MVREGLPLLRILYNFSCSDRDNCKFLIMYAKRGRGGERERAAGRGTGKQGKHQTGTQHYVLRLREISIVEVSDGSSVRMRREVGDVANRLFDCRIQVV